MGIGMRIEVKGELRRNLEERVSEPAGTGNVKGPGAAAEKEAVIKQETASGGRNILLINDFPGYGKVALAAMTPILSRLGHYVFQLPTAVVSNTLDYGRFRIQDMTEFMRDTLVVWKELGFEPECICTGFILSEEQAELIGGYIRELRREQDRQLLVVVDPIMADGGKLYNGIGPERVMAMRHLLVHADVMVPNMTEASFLTGIRPGQETGTDREIRELVEGLREISGKSVVITSAVRQRSTGDPESMISPKNSGGAGSLGSSGGAGSPESSGRAERLGGAADPTAETREIPVEDGLAGNVHLVCGYDHLREEYFEIPYDFLPVRIAGSGDIFSAVMTGELLRGRSLREAAGKAVRALSCLIQENQNHREEYKGIVVERYWELLGAER